MKRTNRFLAIPVSSSLTMQVFKSMKNEMVYKFLAERRSAGILTEPAPSRSEVQQILNVAGTVPDHGKLMPYRFVVFEGESREKFAMSLVNAANENRHEPLDDKLVPKIKAKAY